MLLKLPENMHAISVQGKEFVAKDGLVEMSLSLSASEMELLLSQNIVVVPGPSTAPTVAPKLSIRVEAEVIHPDPPDEAAPDAGDPQE